MNHKIYEDWYFISQDPQAGGLDASQLAELNRHLDDCQSCQRLTSNWRSVDGLIQHSPEMAPEQGFVNRWRKRLELDRQRIQNRQIMLVLTVCFAGIALFTGVFLTLAWPWARTPDLLAWYWISRMISALTLAGNVRESLQIFVGTLTGVIPWGGWVLLAGFACQLAVLWLVSFRILLKPQRVLT